MSRYTAEEVEEAKDLLRRWLQPGATVATIHVSRTDTGRTMRLATARNGRVVDITRWVARVCGYRYNENASTLRLGGGGVDLGFLAVYELGRALFDDRVDPAVTQGRGQDRDGGYMLQHEWF